MTNDALQIHNRILQLANAGEFTENQIVHIITEERREAYRHFGIVEEKDDVQVAGRE